MTEVTNWNYYDKLRVLNSRAIDGGEVLSDGRIYEVISLDYDLLPVISTGDSEFYFMPREMAYVERVIDGDERQ